MLSGGETVTGQSAGRGRSFSILGGTILPTQVRRVGEQIGAVHSGGESEREQKW